MAKTTQNDTYIKNGYLFSVFLYGYDAVPSKCLTYLNLIKHSLLLTFMAVLRYNGVRTMGAGRRAPRLLQATMMMTCARVFDRTNFSASNFVFFFHPHRFSTPIVHPIIIIRCVALTVQYDKIRNELTRLKWLSRIAPIIVRWRVNTTFKSESSRGKRVGSNDEWGVRGIIISSFSLYYYNLGPDLPLEPCRRGKNFRVHQPINGGTNENDTLSQTEIANWYDKLV